MLSHPRGSSAGVLLLALGLLLAVPLTAIAATPGLTERSASTFRLYPGQERVKVKVDLTLTNRKPPSQSTGPCAPGSAQRCRFTTNYFWNEWGLIYVPAGATKVRFGGSGVSSRVKDKTKHWTTYTVTFPQLNFGQTRKVNVTYDLPGMKPRSQHRTRVMDAYSFFCWHGEPADSGTITAILPPGYEATTFGARTTTKSNKKGTTIKAVAKGNPGRFYACTDAFKPERLLRTEMTSPGGQTVIVEGWPEDPDWSTEMGAAVEETLPALEDLIGQAMPLDEVVIREVSKESLGGYGSTFGVRRALIRLGDHIDDPSMAARGLAGAWFNQRRIADDWLQFGLARWAGIEVSGFGCFEPGEYPVKGEPELRTWRVLKEKPSDRLVSIVDYQFDAACWAVSDMASQIGPERMRAVLASVLEDTPKYGTQPAERQGKFGKATWKDWLDAIDELGLVPAGVTDLTVAEQLLKDYGIARPKELKGRANARTEYHAALAAMSASDGVGMPAVVTQSMGKWRFKDALKAIPLATECYAAIAEHPTMSEEDRVAFFERFESTRTTKALRALRNEARAFEPPTDPDPDPVSEAV